VTAMRWPSSFMATIWGDLTSRASSVVNGRLSWALRPEFVEGRMSSCSDLPKDPLELGVAAERVVGGIHPEVLVHPGAILERGPQPLERPFVRPEERVQGSDGTGLHFPGATDGARVHGADDLPTGHAQRERAHHDTHHAAASQLTPDSLDPIPHATVSRQRPLDRRKRVPSSLFVDNPDRRRVARRNQLDGVRQSLRNLRTARSSVSIASKNSPR